MARREVLAHPLLADDEPLDEPGEPVEHVVDGEERVGQDDALGRRVRDVALVPEGDVLEPDDGVRPHDPRDPADALGRDRVALVRHRRRALLAAAERLLDLAHLGAGEMADLGREAIERRGEQGERREQLGVPVALQDLRRARRGLEAEPLAGDALHLGLGGGVGADGAGELARRAGPRSRGRAAPGRGRGANAQPASLSPNVVGSAWTPCVRPMHIVSRCSSARATTAPKARSSPSSTSAPASCTASESAVSSTSDDVSP